MPERTLQLLPGEDRSSYAGAEVEVEVLEQSGGQLMVRYGGEVIPHQETPPRPGALTASNGALALTPELAQVVRNLAQHCLSRLRLQRLATFEAAISQQESSEDDPKAELPLQEKLPHASRPSGKPCPTPGCRAFSLRGIARELGFSRNAVREYADALAPPINRTPRRSTQAPTHHNADGHFP